MSIEEVKEKLEEYRNMAEELAKEKGVKSVQELMECCQKINVLFQELKKLQEIKVPA
jgi:cell fate (sporulation/competence/biofilm development) regulator YmcA (YheA/YmcA/DUF963 family)